MKSPLNRGGLRFCLVLTALLQGSATHATIVAGIPCLALGIILHFWAKGCLRQNVVIAMGGPYRFVRHPFYLANGLIDAGWRSCQAGGCCSSCCPVGGWPSIFRSCAARSTTCSASLGRATRNISGACRGCSHGVAPCRVARRAFAGAIAISLSREKSRALRLAAYPLLFLVRGFACQRPLLLRRRREYRCTSGVGGLYVAAGGSIASPAWRSAGFGREGVVAGGRYYSSHATPPGPGWTFPIGQLSTPHWAN